MRSRLLATVVADDLVDLDDDVLGDAGLYGSAIDHLCEVDGHGQLPHQDTANCHIKNRPTATFIVKKVAELSLLMVKAI